MGLNFRSSFERMIWENAVAQGWSMEYEPSDGILYYNQPRQYLPDFVLPNGIRVEAKGYFRPADRTKLLRVRADNPGVDIRLVFQRPYNKLTRSPNSMTYAQWCDRHGFEWAEGTIPEDWFREKPRNAGRVRKSHGRRPNGGKRC